MVDLQLLHFEAAVDFFAGWVLICTRALYVGFEALGVHLYSSGFHDQKVFIRLRQLSGAADSLSEGCASSVDIHY